METQEKGKTMNNVQLIGYIAQDANERLTADSVSVVSFAVAVNERRQNDGKWENKPNFIDCTMFGKRAAALMPHLIKGARVGIAGHLRQSKWQNDDGNNRSRLQVIVDDIDLLNSKSEEKGEN